VRATFTMSSEARAGQEIRDGAYDNGMDGKAGVLGLRLFLVKAVLWCAVLGIVATRVDAETNLKVTEIRVEGLKRLSADPVLEWSGLKPGDEFSVSAVEAAMSRLEETGEFLEKPDYRFESVGEGVRIVITVREMPILSRILWEGNHSLTVAELTDLIGLVPGQPLNGKALSAGTSRINEEYHKRGFYASQVIGAQVDPESGVLTIRILETQIERIEIEGRRKTREYVFFALIKSKPGEHLNGYRLQRDMYRLWGLGIFEEIPTWQIEEGSEPGKVVVRVSVKEAKTGRFSFGGGYGDTTGFVLQASVSEANFRGTAQTLNVGLSTGTRANTFFINFSNPVFRQRDQKFSWNAFRRENLLDLRDRTGGSSSISRYLVLETGGNIGFSNRFMEVFSYRLEIGSREQKLDLDSGPPLTRDQLEREGFTEGRINTMSHGIRRDSRLDIYDPFQGNVVDVAHTIGFEALGGDFNFQKVTLDLRGYGPVRKKNKDWVLAGRLQIGRGFNNLPGIEQYYVGGSDTVRGHPFGELRGNRMALANLELRLRKQPVGGALFIDTGVASRKGEGLSTKNLITGVGVGIRVKISQLAFLPIRLDLGYNVDDGGTEVHFGFGHIF
jgi:outer membrane protein insertion porin family